MTIKVDGQTDPDEGPSLTFGGPAPAVARRGKDVWQEPASARPAGVSLEEWEAAAPAPPPVVTWKFYRWYGAALLACVLGGLIVGVETTVMALQVMAVIWLAMVPIAIIHGLLRSMTGRSAVPAWLLSDPGHQQLVANDLPRRERRHGPELGDHQATMYATRAVDRGDGRVALELLVYEPVARDAVDLAPAKKGWMPGTSCCGDRFWQMGVADARVFSADAEEAIAAQLVSFEAQAARAERVEVEQLAVAAERERERVASSALTEAATRGVVDGISRWRRTSP